MRETARVPICLFVDPVTGLHVDLGASNQLAVRNTLLLRAYATVDPRVRCLAYIIKAWCVVCSAGCRFRGVISAVAVPLTVCAAFRASARCINDPATGTLSSYGYILLLISFLQRRPQPLVPCLQALPPDWGGHDFAEPGCPIDALPKQYMRNPDGRRCNTYFYEGPVRCYPPRVACFNAPCAWLTGVSDEQAGPLQACAARNDESVGGLLLAFLWEYVVAYVQCTKAPPRLLTHARARGDCCAQVHLWV